MYQQQQAEVSGPQPEGAAGPPPGGADDDIIDAEYEDA
jgi:hypothetical protein